MYSTKLQASKPSNGLVRLIATLFLLSSLIPVGYADNITLPDIGDPSGNLLSPAEDQRLGQAFMRSVRAIQPVITDPLLNAYIQSLGSRLAVNSDDPSRPFHFFLIEDPQVNAFAGPGGYIGVYTGLITTTESESELASVVAHEIAHVTQRHLVRSFDAVQRMSLPMTALAVAALVLGAAAGNTAAGAAAAMGVQAGMVQSQINFTRANEEEADSFGIQILAKADFDPQAMPTFFERMGQATRLYDSGKLPDFLRTHPVTTNRIADARGRAGKYPYRQSPDSLEYHLLRATLRGNEFDTPQEAVIFFSGTLSGRRFRNEEAERYGYVRALMANRQYTEAAEQLDVLLRKRPEHISYLVLQALLLKEQGKPEEGLQVLKDGLDLYPGNYSLSIYYTELLLNQNRADTALTLLDEQIRLRPQDARLYKLSAQAAGKAGNSNLGHQYLAEYYYLNNALEPAIRQLQIALKDDTISYYRSAQMTARLHEFQNESTEMKSRKK